MVRGAGLHLHSRYAAAARDAGSAVQPSGDGYRASQFCWREAFVGGGVAIIGAAVEAGIAVAALSLRVAPAGLVNVGKRLGLPSLPARDVVLHARAGDAELASSLRLLTAAFRNGS